MDKANGKSGSRWSSLRKALLGVVGAAVIVGSVAVSAPASAESPTPVPNAPNSSLTAPLGKRPLAMGLAIRRPTMEKALKLEIALQRAQGKTLERATKEIERVRKLIADEKAAGRNPSAVETALAAFVTAVGDAGKHHDAAKALLDARAGFDADGKVVDKEQARKTITEVRKEQRQFATIMTKAQHDLGKALRSYRQSVSPTATPK